MIRTKINLEHASARLKDDKTVVLAAVNQWGYALEYASSRLKDDEEVVLAAVNQNGGSLEYASDRLQDNPTLVKIALSNNGLALQYASDRLRSDINFCLQCAKIDGDTIDFFLGEADAVFDRYGNKLSKVEDYLATQIEQEYANAALLAKLAKHSSNFPNNQLFKRKPL